MEMSLAENKTKELWQKFMPRRHDVNNKMTTDFISMQIYPENWSFSPTVMFEKWATVEVSSLDEIPEDMETYVLTGGKYAVFTQHGPASMAPKTMQTIFGVWLPASSYQLDNREHFEVLPENYNPTDPNAKEDIWIPIAD